MLPTRSIPRKPLPDEPRDDLDRYCGRGHYARIALHMARGGGLIMGEAVLLSNGDVIKNERGTNDECIAELKRLLVKAEAGEIIGFVGSLQYADGATGRAGGGFVFHDRIAGNLLRNAMGILSE